MVQRIDEEDTMILILRAPKREMVAGHQIEFPVTHISEKEEKKVA